MKKTQKLLTRRLTDTPTDNSLVRSNCGPYLNKEETLSDTDLKTVNNNPEENQSRLTGNFKSATLVFVLSAGGNPLMPCKPAKAKKLLKAGKAIVVRIMPFTIRLNWKTEEQIQRVTLGIDPGYKKVDLSAKTDDGELYSAEIELRTDIPKKLKEKRQYRRTRRNKLWYREARFQNRGGKKKGWLAPSVEHKLESHIKAALFVKSILPVSEINVETAAFDNQKIKNPDIRSADYQNGEQKDFWNVREYVLCRDNHTCQACGGKSKDKVINVHHVIVRADGGTDKPDNLITLCGKCHRAYHKGKIKLSIKKCKQFKAETVMSILRWKIADKLRELGNIVNITYGYLTKSARIALKLPKSHANDAFVIAGGNTQKRADIL